MGQFFGTREARNASLRRAKVKVEFDDVDEKFDIHVLPYGGDPASAVVVMEDLEWGEVVQMKLLIENLGRLC